MCMAPGIAASLHHLMLEITSETGTERPTLYDTSHLVVLVEVEQLLVCGQRGRAVRRIPFSAEGNIREV